MSLRIYAPFAHSFDLRFAFWFTGQQIGGWPETYPEVNTSRTKDYYNKFKPAT